MIENKKGLTIEQLEERFEMAVASKGSSFCDLPEHMDCDCDTVTINE